ncbi:MAG: flagellar motor switch protein FliG [Alphaproteobacteria bacterium]|nr:flagellar motor switch protein FliG [Alphaproteobacteria bacterium]
MMLEALTGQQRAAVLMLSVGEDNAVKLFQHMETEEICDIAQCMARMGKLDREVVEVLLEDFANTLRGRNTTLGTVQNTRKMLSRFLEPDRVRDIVEEIYGPPGKTMWAKLNNVSEQLLANFLKHEYPQTVAVVMSKLDSDYAARVLAELPDSLTMEVLMRMLNIDAVQNEALEAIEITLRNEFMSTLGKAQERDSHEMIANIFNHFDRSTETLLMSYLEEKTPESAERIKKLMFTFDDLTNLPGPSVQVLLREVNKDQLVVALKGTSDAICDLFLSNMSERAAKIMKEDMQATGPLRVRDVEEAQQEIVTLAKDLSDRGQIVIAEDGGEDDFVY